MDRFWLRSSKTDYKDDSREALDPFRFRYVHFELGDPDNKWDPLIGETNEGAFRHTIQTDDVIAVVREPFSGTKAGVLADHTIAFDHNLLTSLVGNHPFAASDSDRFDRLIVNRNKINKRVRSIRRSLEGRHIDNLVNDHAKIGQFPKREAHRSIMRHIE